MALEFKKFSDPNEDAYFKDFLDILDTDSKVGNDLGIIKVAFVRDSVDDIKDNSDVMKDIFGNVENLEVGDSILMANWKNWSNEED
jgi:hypothetical protein